MNYGRVTFLNNDYVSDMSEFDLDSPIIDIRCIFDCSAISVLLGEAWKSLPIEERESYSNKAKVLADEQKKIYPDCWKRKKTVANSATGENKAAAGTPTSKAPPTVTLPLPLTLPPPVHPPTCLSETAQRVDHNSSTVDIV